MRALLLSTDPAPADALLAGGVDVVRCYETDECAALAPDGACPLDAPGGVDVAIARAMDDVGVRCARRARVPVVLSTDAEIVEVCEDAVADSLELLRAAVASETAAVLDRHGCGHVPFAVRVERVEGRLELRVVATVPDLVATMTATRAAVVARRFDPTAGWLSVAVVPART
jgi:hypothetical protein